VIVRWEQERNDMSGRVSGLGFGYRGVIQVLEFRVQGLVLEE
jgi:hypothetical protein